MIFLFRFELESALEFKHAILQVDQIELNTKRNFSGASPPTQYEYISPLDIKY